MARWHKKGIPVQPQNQTAEFAGYQYQADTGCTRDKNHSKHYPIFRDSLYRLIYSNFKWYGIDEFQSRAIEYFLLNEGRVCAIKTEFSLEERTPDGIFFGRPGTDVPNLRYDFYGLPTQCSCTGFNDAIYRAMDTEHFAIGFDTCANFRNQSMIRPTIAYIDQLAEDLDDAYSIWRVAAETRKSGMVFNVPDEKSAGILKRILNKISGNDPWVVTWGNNQAFAETTQPFFAPNNTQALTDYHDHFLNIWSSVMDLIGLENNPSNKKERMIVSEAESNKNTSRYLAADRLKARKEFADEINRKFGTSIRVENYLASIAQETMNNANVYGDAPDESPSIGNEVGTDV